MTSPQEPTHSPLVSDFWKTVTTAHDYLRNADIVSIEQIQLALVRCDRYGAAIGIDAAGTPERDVIEPALRIVRSFVDEVICRAASLRGLNDSALRATTAGESILHAFGYTQAEVQAQALWWRVLNDYAHNRKTFATLHANLSAFDQERRGTRSLRAGIAMLMQDRSDLALPCFDYAYSHTGPRVPMHSDLELSDWVAEVEPEAAPDRLRIRRLLIAETLTNLIEERHRDGYGATAAILERRRHVVLGPLAASEVSTAGLPSQHYISNTPISNREVATRDARGL